MGLRLATDLKKFFENWISFVSSVHIKLFIIVNLGRILRGPMELIILHIYVSKKEGYLNL